MYDENFILYDGDNSQPIASSTDAIEIDYQKLEDTFFDALLRYENDYQLRSNTLESQSDDSIVEFNSSTDATMYTVGVDVAPTSSAQQNTILLLEIRNLILIFLFSWLLLTAYSKIKNLMINYHKS